MFKRFVAMFGLILFVGGLGLIVFLNKGKSQALAKDNTDKKFGIIASDTPPCTWNLELSQRILAEDKSQSVIVNTQNDTDEPCQSSLSLIAPGFDISPAKSEQMLTAKPKSPGSLAWVIAPRRSGTFELAVSDGLVTETRGVKVTNTLGLSAGQVQVIGIVAPIFGPMFTIPWWFDKWQQRKNRLKTSPEPQPQKVA